MENGDTKMNREIVRLADFDGQTIEVDGIFECGERYPQFGLPLSDGKRIAFVYQNTNAGKVLEQNFDQLVDLSYKLKVKIVGRGVYIESLTDGKPLVPPETVQTRIAL